MRRPDLDGPVAKYFAINLRQAREAKDLSQADLALRVKELGQPCTQATIWKLEQGVREPKLTEAVAIGQALDLLRWTDLTRQPETFEIQHRIDLWRQRVYELAERTRAAAAAQVEALAHLALLVRQAQDAGLSADWASGGWLEFTPEATVLREVLAARVAWDSEDDESDRRMTERDRLAAQIMSALESSGVPLVIKPDDIEFDGPESATVDHDQTRNHLAESPEATS
jgi:transcriptional regulator with XRE-family HTH domain